MLHFILKSAQKASRSFRITQVNSFLWSRRFRGSERNRVLQTEKHKTRGRIERGWKWTIGIKIVAWLMKF
jgi:hypothetical protein